MNKEKLEYRIYCLVLKQLNPINKGVQMAHSCLEYAQKYHNELDYQQYVTEDKTLIMLDGGIAPEMEYIASELYNANINHTVFREPDLNNLITSICFLADERVWNTDKYTQSEDDFNEMYDEDYDWFDHIGGYENTKLIEILKGKRLSL